MDEDKKKALTLKAIKRRFLKEAGIDVENLSIEDLAIKIYELEHVIDSLQTKKKHATPKQFVSLVIANFRFSKSQKALLKALDSMKPVAKWKLKQETGSANIKSLVKDTNKTLKNYEEDKKSKLRTLYISKCKNLKPEEYYQLLRFVQVKK